MSRPLGRTINVGASADTPYRARETTSDHIPSGVEDRTLVRAQRRPNVTWAFGRDIPLSCWYHQLDTNERKATRMTHAKLVKGLLIAGPLFLSTAYGEVQVVC